MKDYSQCSLEVARIGQNSLVQHGCPVFSSAAGELPGPRQLARGNP